MVTRPNTSAKHSFGKDPAKLGKRCGARPERTSNILITLFTHTLSAFCRVAAKVIFSSDDTFISLKP